MKTLLFSASGRIPRSQYWKGALVILALGFAANVLAYLLARYVGGSAGSAADDGVQISFSGPAAVPVIAFAVVSFWAGLCLGIKRSHDRGRSGAFVILTFIPLLDIWYFVEVGCLRGTLGTNAYGPDPLGTTGRAAIAGAT